MKRPLKLQSLQFFMLVVFHSLGQKCVVCLLLLATVPEDPSSLNLMHSPTPPYLWHFMTCTIFSHNTNIFWPKCYQLLLKATYSMYWLAGLELMRSRNQYKAKNIYWKCSEHVFFFNILISLPALPPTSAHTAWQACAQKRLVHARSDFSWFRRNLCVYVCSAHVCSVIG